MIIISDCVRNNLDEGCIKLASSLSKRLQKNGAFLMAVNTECSYADSVINANKIYTSKALYDAMKGKEGDILYIPFASNTLGTAIRTLNLTKKTGRKVSVLLTMRWKMNFLTKFILNKAGCNIITVSQESYEFFSEQLPKLYIENVKTGVDVSQFTMVDEQTKKSLRKKYSIPEDKTVILHVGHLKYGRNIDKFLSVDEQYHVVLVFSSVTEKDGHLKELLKSKNNIQIIEEYIPNVEEVYQASDLYVFPIVEESNSIDIPLSVLEAAGCNLKIVSTRYKEIAYFKDVPGFWKIDNQQLEDLNSVLKHSENCDNVNTREIAKEYSWDNSVIAINKLIK